MAKKGQEKLVETVSKAPNEEWIRSFFGLAEYLISEIELPNDDPRLVMSLPESGSIPIIINNRYVLVAYRTELSRAEFILPPRGGALDTYLDRTDRQGRFKAIYGEDQSERPWFVGFDGDPQRVVDDNFKRLWLSAAKAEIKRAKKSPYQEYHEPVVYRAVQDIDYREQVFDEAFE